MSKLTPPHGGQPGAIARRFGIASGELLDFSANINPDGAPPSVVQALKAALGDPATLNLYPDLDEVKLKSAIASYAGADPSQVAAANGFVPLLEAALRTLAIRRCLLPVPAFTEYRRTLERAQVQIMAYPLLAAECFRYASLPPGDCDAILLANPQNPSGIGTAYQEMLDIVSDARRETYSYSSMKPSSTTCQSARLRARSIASATSSSSVPLPSFMRCLGCVWLMPWQTPILLRR